jgi:hypothetical protein
VPSTESTVRGYIRDTTEHKLQERELEEHREYTTAILDANKTSSSCTTRRADAGDGTDRSGR